MMTKHVGHLPVDEYMARDGGRTFWITRESGNTWTVWCKVGSANLAVLGHDMRPLNFVDAEECIRLFRDASAVEAAWNNFLERIAMHEGIRERPVLDARLGDQRMWRGNVNIPTI